MESVFWFILGLMIGAGAGVVIAWHVIGNRLERLIKEAEDEAGC